MRFDRKVRGTITRKHALLIWYYFGWRAAWRTVRGFRGTFLEIAMWGVE